ncbi:2-iminobutanoate/2-iminopropanoate deaminase [Rugosimonospora acidiphila]|uniref:2-iminobutanoate/2-iminopropanoate deaminase n=1 Tax=Rugosimonospora acidiphila TaxID=556531 RepID=A0ABP9SRU7_9ACTN
MSRRKTFEIPGVDHGAAPIPMAAQVGAFFHSSGIPPTDPATGSVPEDGTRQVELVFGNAAALLKVAGLGPADVVYFDVYLADDTLRGEVNKYWLEWYPQEHDRPARHVTVRPLPGKMLVQLQVQAVADGPA